MAEGTKTTQGLIRWWEFYFVRYAMGTIAGGLIVLMLCVRIPALTPILLGLDLLQAGVSTKGILSALPVDRIPLLAAYGLVYCYIASTPILVFHAGRFALKSGRLILFVFVACMFALVAALFVESVRVPSALLAFAGVALFQFWVAARTIWQSKDLYAFYEKLSKARASSDSGELVESYRHLREHGNSVFILFLEILLGVALLWVSQNWAGQPMPALILVLLAWVLPSVAVWLIATLFEREFIADPPKAQP